MITKHSCLLRGTESQGEYTSAESRQAVDLGNFLALPAAYLSLPPHRASSPCRLVVPEMIEKVVVGGKFHEVVYI